MNRGLPASHGHASAEAGANTSGDSHAGVSVGVSGDNGGWSVDAYGSVSHDHHGHTSGEVGVGVSVPF